MATNITWRCNVPIWWLEVALGQFKGPMLPVTPTNEVLKAESERIQQLINR